MESKVREATNNEPWGASTSLMAQIAAGTYNYREREEILSFIFRRFTEKAANEWRQIYKALQLLDYLIKNGSERIIDDVRANSSLIQMLKSFHYIDSKGRDQGVNVRNRSKNLLSLLNDDALIRLERKKARGNAKKFGGVSSAAYGGASSISVGGTGFGGDDGITNAVYGDGGVFGARYDDPASAYDNGATGTDNNFEEYDVEATSSSHAAKPTTGSSKVNATSSSKNKVQPKAPQEDLLGDLVSFDAAPGASSTAAPATNDDDEDDFDDFQTAPSLSAASTGNLSNNLANLYVSQPSGLRQQQPQTTQFQPQFPQAQQQNYAPSAVNSFGPTSTSSGPAKPSNDAFSSLFSSAKTKTTSTPASAAPAQTSAPAAKTAFDDDLLGGFSSTKTSAPSQNKSASGEVDLLSF